MAVAQRGHVDARGEVDVAVAVHVDQHAALARLEGHGKQLDLAAEPLEVLACSGGGSRWTSAPAAEPRCAERRSDRLCPIQGGEIAAGHGVVSFADGVIRLLYIMCKLNISCGPWGKIGGRRLSTTELGRSVAGGLTADAAAASHEAAAKLDPWVLETVVAHCARHGKLQQQRITLPLERVDVAGRNRQNVGQRPYAHSGSRRLLATRRQFATDRRSRPPSSTAGNLAGLDHADPAFFSEARTERSAAASVISAAQSAAGRIARGPSCPTSSCRRRRTRGRPRPPSSSASGPIRATPGRRRRADRRRRRRERPRRPASVSRFDFRHGPGQIGRRRPHIARPAATLRCAGRTATGRRSAATW